jgi:hypothetical protein
VPAAHSSVTAIKKIGGIGWASGRVPASSPSGLAVRRRSKCAREERVKTSHFEPAISPLGILGAVPRLEAQRGECPPVFTALATVRRHFAVQLHGMAATLEKICPICDMIHTFVLADAMADKPEDREYWFTCPKKEKVGAMKFDQLADVWALVSERPRGSVQAY